VKKILGSPSLQNLEKTPMEQPIVGFHKDDEDHWVARLPAAIINTYATIHPGSTAYG